MNNDYITHRYLIKRSNKYHLGYKLANIVENIIGNSINLLKTSESPLKVHDIFYTTKQGENKGQFGYYSSASRAIECLCEIVEFFKINHLYDLGSGIGILPYILCHAMQNNIQTTGYENEQRLIDLGKSLLHYKSVEKDILKLKRADLKISGIIYFWEPMCAPKQRMIFLNNLIRNIREDHYIVCVQQESTGILNANNKVLYFTSHGCLNVYKLNTTKNRKELSLLMSKPKQDEQK